MPHFRDLRGSPDVIFSSGASPSHGLMVSTMLPQAKRRLKAAPRKFCYLQFSILNFRHAYPCLRAG